MKRQWQMKIKGRWWWLNWAKVVLKRKAGLDLKRVAQQMWKERRLTSFLKATAEGLKEKDICRGNVWDSEKREIPERQMECSPPRKPSSNKQLTITSGKPQAEPNNRISPWRQNKGHLNKLEENFHVQENGTKVPLPIPSNKPNYNPRALYIKHKKTEHREQGAGWLGTGAGWLGTLGPEEWHTPVFPGLLFALYIPELELKKLATQKCQCIEKKKISNKTLLSLTEGPGKG